MIKRIVAENGDGLELNWILSSLLDYHYEVAQIKFAYKNLSCKMQG